MADNADIAANVRAELARGKHPHQDIAELLGLSRMSIHRRLTGETPFRADELGKIAKHIGVPVAELLGEQRASA
jgi:transcriptional regulator with XRE-family HTH domain